MMVPGVLIQCVLLTQFSGPAQPSDGLRMGPDQRAMSAKEWIEELLTAPPEGGLPGTPVTLMASLRGIRGERRQQEVIDAYWQLSKMVARYYVAAQVYRVVRTERITTGEPGTAESMRTVAELRLEAARSRLAAIEAQADLAARIHWSGDTLPLPVNRPHVGAYHTRYNEIFEKYPNEQARRLHHLLASEIELIHAHAELLNALASAPQEGPADAARFRAECGEFLDAVDRYNRNIARYVLLASDDAADGQEIVPMLIKVERDALDQSRMATEPNRQSTTTVPNGDPSVPVGANPNGPGVVPAHAEVAPSDWEAGPIPDDVERSVLVHPMTNSDSGRRAMSDRQPPNRPGDPGSADPGQEAPAVRVVPEDSGWRGQMPLPTGRG